MRLWRTTWHENKAVRKNIASIQRTYAYFHSSDRGKELGSEEADYGRLYGRLAARRIHG